MRGTEMPCACSLAALHLIPSIPGPSSQPTGPPFLPPQGKASSPVTAHGQSAASGAALFCCSQGWELAPGGFAQVSRTARDAVRQWLSAGLSCGHQPANITLHQQPREHSVVGDCLPLSHIPAEVSLVEGGSRDHHLRNSSHTGKTVFSPKCMSKMRTAPAESWSHCHVKVCTCMGGAGMHEHPRVAEHMPCYTNSTWTAKERSTTVHSMPERTHTSLSAPHLQNSTRHTL